MTLASSCAHAPAAQSSLKPVLDDRAQIDLGYIEPAALHHYLLGQHALRADDDEAAAGEFRLSLVHDPSASAVYEALSATWFRRGYLVRAVDVLELGLGRVENESELHVALMNLHWQLRDFQSVLASYQAMSPSKGAPSIALQPMVLDSLLWLERKDAAWVLVDDVVAHAEVEAVPSVLALAGVLEDHGALKRAERVYGVVQGLWPGSYDAAMGLVRIAAWQDDPGKAHDVLLGLAAHQPRSPWVMVDLFEAARGLEELELAETYSSEAIRRAFGDPDLSASLYQWLAMLGDERAVASLEALVNEFPKRWALREALLSSLSLPGEATRCLGLVDAVAKPRAEAHVWATRCLLHLGESERARQRAQLARRAGLEARPLIMLALLMGRHEKSYEAGLTTLRSLLPELDPEDVSRRLAEGQLADDWGNSGPVVAILEKASSQPGWLDGRELTEGVWRVHHGESEQGLRLLETALLHSPEDPDRLNAFGFTLVEQGKNTREAEILLRRAYRLDSEAGFVLDSLGWLFFRQGRLDEAALWLGRALRLRPDDPEVIYHMGRLHGATGDELEAQRSYEQALELHPAQALVRQIREQLGRSMP